MIFEDINKVIKCGRSADDYQRDYDFLISEARNRAGLAGGYFEIHHIIPRCIGGNNEQDNLVALTAREHIIAHLLLYRIHPDNAGLALAAGLMISVVKINTAGGYRVLLNEKLETIRSIDIDTFALLRLETHSSLRKPVVCFIGEKIYKIYDSCTAAKEDGFAPDAVSSISERYPEKCFYKGYSWAKLESFLAENQELVERFFSNREETTPIPLTKEESDELRANQQKHKVIVCTKDGKIEHIYESIKDVASGGFTRATVCDKIDTGNEYYERLWYTISGYYSSWPGREIDYSKESTEYNASSIFLEQPAVVAYSNAVCKVYSRILDAEVDGFSSGGIQQSIKTGGKSGGYYWMRYLDFVREYPDRVPSRDIKICAEVGRKEIVAAEEDGKYIKSYKSIGSVEKDGISAESVRKSISRAEGSVYRGICWYTKDYYCSRFSIDKERDISTLIKSRPKYSRNRKSIVMCNDSNDILKIYESIESTIKDGYRPGSIRKVLIRRTNLSSGKRWYYFEDYKSKYPDKVEEYRAKTGYEI